MRIRGVYGVAVLALMALGGSGCNAMESGDASAEAALIPLESSRDWAQKSTGTLDPDTAAKVHVSNEASAVATDGAAPSDDPRRRGPTSTVTTKGRANRPTGAPVAAAALAANVQDAEDAEGLNLRGHGSGGGGGGEVALGRVQGLGKIDTGGRRGGQRVGLGSGAAQNGFFADAAKEAPVPAWEFKPEPVVAKPMAQSPPRPKAKPKKAARSKSERRASAIVTSDELADGFAGLDIDRLRPAMEQVEEEEAERDEWKVGEAEKNSKDRGLYKDVKRDADKKLRWDENSDDAPAGDRVEDGKKFGSAVIAGKNGSKVGVLRGELAQDQTGVERNKNQWEVRAAQKKVAQEVMAGERDGRFLTPGQFLPQTGYFENTYLGGNAAYLERMRRLSEAEGRYGEPWLRSHSAPVPIDAPDSAGLALTASLSQTAIDRPQRVFLQVALRGSDRYGWRRPALDMAVVVDAGVSASDAESAIAELVRRLGPQDRLGVFWANGNNPIEVTPVDALGKTRAALLQAATPDARAAGWNALPSALKAAGTALDVAAGAKARIPGTQVVLVLGASGAQDLTAVRDGAAVLALQGAVVSVIAMGQDLGEWWSVAHAGHGQLHRPKSMNSNGLGVALEAELSALSRVVARLARLNIRLAPGVKAIRIIGSTMLNAQEKAAVKAREEATDARLSETLGIKADRGDDDDGLQTVIPAFLGGDTHAVIIELWVEKAGPIADISLKYKDMVSLGNATAQTSVTMGFAQKSATDAERVVWQTTRHLEVAEALEGITNLNDMNAIAALQRSIGRAPRATQDALRPLMEVLTHPERRSSPAVLMERLAVVRMRIAGHSNPAQAR